MKATTNTFRIDPDYLRRADAIKTALQRENPDLRYTRMDVLRMALSRGFDKIVEEMHNADEAI